jgi:anti-anti-sigma factor
MRLSVSRDHGLPVLSVAGDLDAAGVHSFAAALDTCSDAYRSSVVIDLTDCAFIDSGGLNVLFQTVRRLDGTAWLGLVGANADLRRVFETVRLTSAPSLRLFDGSSDVHE